MMESTAYFQNIHSLFFRHQHPQYRDPFSSAKLSANRCPNQSYYVHLPPAIQCRNGNCSTSMLHFLEDILRKVYSQKSSSQLKACKKKPHLVLHYLPERRL